MFTDKIKLIIRKVSNYIINAYFHIIFYHNKLSFNDKNRLN